jgi:hypothetical protein
LLGFSFGSSDLRVFDVAVSPCCVTVNVADIRSST